MKKRFHAAPRQRVLETKKMATEVNKNRVHSHHHLFRNKPIQIGFKSVENASQRATVVMQDTVKWRPSFVYLEETVVFSKNFLNYILHMMQVLDLLDKVEVILKLKKICFYTDMGDVMVA